MLFMYVLIGRKDEDEWCVAHGIYSSIEKAIFAIKDYPEYLLEEDYRVIKFPVDYKWEQDFSIEDLWIDELPRYFQTWDGLGHLVEK